MVSQALAARFWPGETALGKRFRVAADGPLITVVGIVGEVTQDWLVDSLRPAFYLPFDQEPTRNFYVVLRTVTDPIQLAAGLRAAVQAEDPELPVVGLRTMEGVIEDRTVGLRFAGTVAGRDCRDLGDPRRGGHLQPDGVPHGPPHARDGRAHGARRDQS